MVVYYAQILNTTTKRILCGEFTAAGEPFRDDKQLLTELKSAALSLAKETGERLYNVNTRNGKHTMYFKALNGLLFCLIGDQGDSNTVINGVIEELSSDFFKRYSDIIQPKYEFEPRMRAICNDKNKSTRIWSSVNELENVHGVLVKNLDSLINRGENINNLRDLADRVNLETKELSRRANQLKIQAQVDKYKLYLILVIILLLVGYFLFK